MLKKFQKNICRALLIPGTHYILLFITHKYLCLFDYKTFHFSQLKHLKLHKTITKRERMQYFVVNVDYYQYFRIIHNQVKDELTVFGWFTFHCFDNDNNLNVPLHLLKYMSKFYRENDEIYIICSKEHHVDLPSSWD